MVAALARPAADPALQTPCLGQGLVLLGSLGGEGVEGVPDGGREGAYARQVVPFAPVEGAQQAAVGGLGLL